MVNSVFAMSLQMMAFGNEKFTKHLAKYQEHCL